MWRILSILLFLVLTNSSVCADLQVTSRAFGKEYKVTVTTEDWKRTPEWKKDQENPPVSARKALDLATAMKDSFVDTISDSPSYDPDFKWDFDSLRLKQYENKFWYWEVVFMARRNAPSTGFPSHICFVVLMDGTAPKPVASERKK
jgi:hypothetical protein